MAFVATAAFVTVEAASLRIVLAVVPPVVPPTIPPVVPPVVPPPVILPPEIAPGAPDVAKLDVPILEIGLISAPGLTILAARIAMLARSIAVLINPFNAPTTFAKTLRTTLAMSPIMLKALPITVPIIGAAALTTSKNALNSSLFSITVALILSKAD